MLSIKTKETQTKEYANIIIIYARAYRANMYDMHLRRLSLS